MKKIHNGILLLALVAIGFSCADPALDPLKFDEIKKGTILALRGAALTNVYVKGTPIAEIFPRIANGTEKFTFEAEILATDPATVASVDVFAIKKVGTATERKLLTNVPYSQFAKGAYPNPSATISVGISSVLSALGLTATYPLSTANINTLLSTYKFGIPIEVDMNLVDGTKVLAADIVAAGLFQSNQFYPAMKLTWTITDYCSYTPTWSGTYESLEVYSNGVYGPYDLVLTQDAGDPNRYNMTNFWDSGIAAYVVFTPSTNPSTQVVKFPDQTDGGGKSIKSTTGTYDECTKTFKIQTQYDGSDWRYEFKKK